MQLLQASGAGADSKTSSHPARHHYGHIRELHVEKRFVEPMPVRRARAFFLVGDHQLGNGKGGKLRLPSATWYRPMVSMRLEDDGVPPVRRGRPGSSSSGSFVNIQLDADRISECFARCGPVFWSGPRGYPTPISRPVSARAKDAASHPGVRRTAAGDPSVSPSQGGSGQLDRRPPSGYSRRGVRPSASASACPVELICSPGHDRVQEHRPRQCLDSL